MIVDRVKNLGDYSKTIPMIEMIIDFINRNNLTDLQLGVHKIDGDNLFVNIEEYDTVDSSEKRLESHKGYIDIQVVISGEEYMGYSNIDGLVIDEDILEERDLLFYKGDSEIESNILVRSGTFAIFFPEDAHMPGIFMGRSCKVKKGVFKIRIN